MQTYLFSDSDVWHFSIEAKSFNGALRIAKDIHGICVPLRCVREYGSSKDYRSSITGYECSLRLVG